MGLSTIANPNHGHNRYPRFYFEAHMNILFIIEVKILGLIKWLYKSIRAPPNYVDYKVHIGYHIVRSLLNTCLFGIHSWRHT